MGPSFGSRGFKLSRSRPFASHCVVVVAVVVAIVVVERLACTDDTRLAVGDVTCVAFSVLVVVAGDGAAIVAVTLVAELATALVLVKSPAATTPTAGVVSVVDACLGFNTSLGRPPAVHCNAAPGLASGACSPAETDVASDLAQGGGLRAARSAFVPAFICAFRKGTMFLRGGVSIPPLRLCRLPGRRSFRMSRTSVQFATAL
mmetsp:Transcript_55643/g.110557  ORF Transcript_55643/g.110557 Transcript_55643/m.110557 type:complete len:203 (+) Transcript_55643:446-1054(+)